MPDIGLSELVLILIVALVIFGPGRIPEIGHALGKAIREFRQATTGMNDPESPAASEANQENNSRGV